MRKKTLFLLGAGAAAMLTIGSLAQAGMKGGMGAGMGAGMGSPRCAMLRHGPGMMGRPLMERYDANKDGKVTQAEIDQNRQQWLAEFDVNKDGTLSLEEFKQLWLKSRNEMMVREFQFLDRDGNSQVTVEEYKGPMADLVATRDRNDDGSLGADDRPGPGEGKGWRHGMAGEGRGPCMGGGDGPGQPGDAPDEPPGGDPASP